MIFQFQPWRGDVLFILGVWGGGGCSKKIDMKGEEFL